MVDTECSIRFRVQQSDATIFLYLSACSPSITTQCYYNTIDFLLIPITPKALNFPLCGRVTWLKKHSYLGMNSVHSFIGFDQLGSQKEVETGLDL